MNRMGLFLIIIFTAASAAFATIHEIGPDKTYTNIGDFPWQTDNALVAGDTVLIYHKATPYREKWIIGQSGTVAQPITIRGVPDQSGNLPVIDGEDASTDLGLYYVPNSAKRGILQIGETDYPRNDNSAAYLVIENLEFANAHEDHTFTNDRAVVETYKDEAAGIVIRECNNITIRNCIFRDCGNGLTTVAGEQWVDDLLIEGCYFYNNGIVSSIKQHNLYIQGGVIGLTIQYCRFGPLLAGAKGSNLKERAAGTVIRYNWIQDGQSCLDLVDGEASEVLNHPSYPTVYVYGNVLIKTDISAALDYGKVCHFGGDISSADKTQLYFYNNTIISKMTTERLFPLRLHTGGTVDFRNNIVHATATQGRGSEIGFITELDGSCTLYNNWLTDGWKESWDTNDRQHPGVTIGTGNISNTAPGLVDISGENFTLASGSACIDAGTSRHASVPAAQAVILEYLKHQTYTNRPSDSTFDMGAYERSVVDPDSDGDNILDAWEMSTFGNLTTANASSDYDSDGFLDWQEAMANTSAMSSDSLLEMTTVSAPPVGNPSITWASAAGVTYSVSRSTNLLGGRSSFTKLQTNIAPDVPLNTFIDSSVPAGAPGVYYSIEID